MRIVKAGTVHVVDGKKLHVAGFTIDCERVAYARDAEGGVDMMGMHYQRDLLAMIVIGMLDGTYEPQAQLAGEANHAINRARFRE